MIGPAGVVSPLAPAGPFAARIIWPRTTRVGCALASNRGADYLVCHYSPAGNVDGRRVGSPAAPVTRPAR